MIAFTNLEKNAGHQPEIPRPRTAGLTAELHHYEQQQEVFHFSASYRGPFGRAGQARSLLSVARRTGLQHVEPPGLRVKKPLCRIRATIEKEARVRSGVVFRSMDLRSAAAPATKGVANDVPLADA